MGTELDTNTLQGEESHILEQLTLIVRSQDPDIITGYNIDNFDLAEASEIGQMNSVEEAAGVARLHYLAGAELSNQEQELKRTRTGPGYLSAKQPSLNLSTGRSVVDAWWQTRMTIRPQRETLSYVAKLLFPDDEERHKMDVDASKMDEEWASRPDVVMEYCIRDAELPSTS